LPLLAWDAWEDFMHRAFEEQYEAAQERARTMTPRRRAKATIKELAAYGYAKQELEGKSIDELRALLYQEKGGTPHAATITTH
jgi:hypothetical protein